MTMTRGAHESTPPARILLVDDEPDNLELLGIILAHEGFVTQSAGSGVEALASVAMARPDLILLDVMMPGMDGFEVVSALKGNPLTRGIPVIMVTALDTRNARKLARNVGAEGFITKPLDRVHLCSCMRSLLFGTLPIQ
jgi:CheY-like chemotaxis protein